MSLLDFYYYATSVTSEVAEVKKIFFFLNLTFRWTLFVKTIFLFRKSVSSLCDYTATEALLRLGLLFEPLAPLWSGTTNFAHYIWSKNKAFCTAILKKKKSFKKGEFWLGDLFPWEECFKTTVDFNFFIFGLCKLLYQMPLYL